MKKKWFVIAIILVTIINLSALGTYVYHYGFTKTSCNTTDTVSHGCYMKSCIDITDSQATQLDAYEKGYRPKFEHLSSLMKGESIELVRELMKESPDSTHIEQILKRVDSLQAEIQREVIRRLIEEKRILTPKQQEKFFSLVLGKFCKENLNHSECQQLYNNDERR